MSTLMQILFPSVAGERRFGEGGGVLAPTQIRPQIQHQNQKRHLERRRKAFALMAEQHLWFFVCWSSSGPNEPQGAPGADSPGT